MFYLQVFQGIENPPVELVLDANTYDNVLMNHEWGEIVHDEECYSQLSDITQYESTMNSDTSATGIMNFVDYIHLFYQKSRNCEL